MSFGLGHPFLLVYNLGCLKTQQTEGRNKGDGELKDKIALQQTYRSIGTNKAEHNELAETVYG